MTDKKDIENSVSEGKWEEGEQEDEADRRVEREEQIKKEQ